MSRGAGRIGDLHLCPMISVGPHGGGPMVAVALPPVPVLADGEAALRLGDMGLCPGALDPALEGAAKVLVGGLPWVGRFHVTAHGGMLVGASSKIVLGGPTFAPPPLVMIRGPAWFQNQVVRDLFALYSQTSGKELWRRIAAAGQIIVIIPENNPHNSFAAAVDSDAAARRQPTGAIVMYNPAVGMFAFDARARRIPLPPQLVLAHEMVHALDCAEGHFHQETVDPQPPASQPGIEEVEAAAIGTGSHSRDYPTENSFRRDFALPRRDNHYSARAPAPTGNFRPGGY